MPFGTVMTKLKLFHVVERKMYQARQTFRDKLPFVNSTKSLIFHLTKILLPKRLVLTHSLIAKVMHYQILYAEFSIGQGFLPEVQLKLSIIHVRAITSALLLRSPVHLQTIPRLPWQPIQNNSTTKMNEMREARPTGSFLGYLKEVQTKEREGLLVCQLRKS